MPLTSPSHIYHLSVNQYAADMAFSGRGQGRGRLSDPGARPKRRLTNPPILREISGNRMTSLANQSEINRLNEETETNQHSNTNARSKPRPTRKYESGSYERDFSSSTSFEGQRHRSSSRARSSSRGNQDPPPHGQHQSLTRGRGRGRGSSRGNQNPSPHGKDRLTRGRERDRGSSRGNQDPPPHGQDQRLTRGHGRGATNTTTRRSSLTRDKYPATKRPLAIKQLKEILSKESAEILLQLSTEKIGFNELINEEKLPMDWMALILAALAKACHCTSAPHNLRTFLTSVWHSHFVRLHLQHFAICLPTGRDANKPDALDEKPVEDLITLLRTLLQHFPSSCYEVGVIVIILEQTTISSGNQTQHKVPSETVDRIRELKEIYKILASQNVYKNSKSGKTEMIERQNLTPPDDFRSITIIPNIEELRNTDLPFLRKNRIKGKYEDTKHYLDVQFRLLREDFVAPLREGISEYLTHQDPSKRLQDMRLYRNVRIIRRSLTQTGLAHLIRFDIRQFKGMQWGSSKRLMNGSLVCLTQDNFESVIFATVEKREIEDLQDGFVVVKFPKGDVEDVSRDVQFLMAETSAYYESYIHVLRCLQEFGELKFPFQSYIVDASVDESPPSYLRPARMRYDLRPLSKSRQTSGASQTSVSLSLSQEHDQSLRSVDVLQSGQWFDPGILGFDESQLKAYQAALSKEFVLIQGPPGTGKTFVGLKIVRTLFFNYHAWSQIHLGGIQQNGRPMLIVCYTNHALDQFLEGIYRFENKIVRVGGRKTSGILEECGLANIRQRIRNEKKLSSHVHNKRSDVRREHYRVRKSLEIAEAHLQFAQKGILNAHILRNYMDDRHRSSGRSMCSWLGLRNNVFYRDIKDIVSEGEYITSSDANNHNDDNINIIDEAEIQSERRILEDNHYLSDSYDRDGNFVDSPLTHIREDFEFLPFHLSGEEGHAPSKAEVEKERLVAFAINNLDVMSELEARAIENMWDIAYQQRWRLYRYWLMGYIRKWESVLLSQVDEYEELSCKRKEIDNEEDYLILRSARVIGMTTTGAAKYRHLLQRLQPAIIVVEEAAEVLEAHVITTLSKGCQHLILIGDQQQLRPNPTVYRLAKDFNLDVSLFERMINNGLPCYRLDFQHRMSPDISTIMKKHFYTGLNDGAKVFQYKDVLGIRSNMFYVEHEEPEKQIEDTRSKSNIHEAKFLVSLCRYILKQGYQPSQITILTTYAGQLSNFRQLMNKKTFENVKVTVVDNYQGEENEIILLSLVRSNDEGSVGFLKVANRVCVALSRAKQGLFCIGNMKLLARKSKLWKDIVMTLKEKKQIGPALPLGCQNHPETVTMVSCENDFKKVPEGGCMRPCEARLDCGHSCTMRCHPFDPNHEESRCKKDCSMKCPRDHRCSLKCYQECECRVRVLKTFGTCEHTAEVYCYKFDDSTCPKPCPEKLPCGHSCPSKCGLDCPTVCQYSCRKKLSCGHPCPEICGSECPTKCNAKCATIIACGHLCNVKCHDSETPCRDARRCDLNVNVPLLKCDHRIRMKCNENPANDSTKDYPECTKICQISLRCGHKCPNKCEDQCVTTCHVRVKKTWESCRHTELVECFKAEAAVCKEPCGRNLSCDHWCAKPCGEPCNSSSNTCNQQCKLKLKCGHRCKNKCGAECTKICEVQTLKNMVHCTHSQRIPCGVDPAEASCKGKCLKTFPCGHPCKEPCGEVCENMCNTIINIPRKNCSHSQETVCGTDPTDTPCREPCAKPLKCHHMCPNKCYEPCAEMCKAKVMKKHTNCGHEHMVGCGEDSSKIVCQKPCQKVLKCGHTLELPCNVDSSASLKCQKKCEKKLKCGHLCQERCGIPCTAVCKEEVIKQLPSCGHPVHFPCHRDPNTIFCKQLCGKRLDCGHVCRNSCGDKCHRQEIGQQHQTTCDDICNTILMCGHQCLSKCKDCLGGRFHQPCQVSVHDVKLICGCQYSGACSKRVSARHCERNAGRNDKRMFPLSRSGHQRFCVLGIKVKSTGELADSCKHVRNPRPGQLCNEPCDQALECSHQCIGLCGEPCPDLCRFCDRLQVISISSELQMVNHDPQYITLEKCGHLVEVGDLNRKVHTEGTDGCKPVLPLACPTCSQPVTHRRFEQHNATVQRQIEEIQDEIETIETITAREAEHALKESDYEFKSVTSTLGLGRSRRTITKEILRKAHLESKWILTILKRLKILQTRLQSCIILCKDATIRNDMTKHIERLKETTICLEEMLDHRLPLTKQIAHDLYKEIAKAYLCNVIMRKLIVSAVPIRVSTGLSGEKKRSTLLVAAQIVTSSSPFTKTKQEEVQNLIDEVCGMNALSGLETFEQVFGQLRRAQVSFEAGAWTVCTKGHIFHYKYNDGEESIVCPKCFR